MKTIEPTALNELREKTPRSCFWMYEPQRNTPESMCPGFIFCPWTA